jgi:predicted membrane channel-forming protein YqfA (hemolysin III family)
MNKSLQEKIFFIVLGASLIGIAFNISWFQKPFISFGIFFFLLGLFLPLNNQMNKTKKKTVSRR